MYEKCLIYQTKFHRSKVILIASQSYRIVAKLENDGRNDWPFCCAIKSNRDKMFRFPFRISKEFEFERNEKFLKSKLSLSRSLSLSRILGENCVDLPFLTTVWYNRMCGGYHAPSYVSCRVDLVLADNLDPPSSALPRFSLFRPLPSSTPFGWWNQFRLVRRHLATPFPRLLYVARILRKYIGMFSGN